MIRIATLAIVIAGCAPVTVPADAPPGDSPRCECATYAMCGTDGAVCAASRPDCPPCEAWCATGELICDGAGVAARPVCRVGRDTDTAPTCRIALPTGM